MPIPPDHSPACRAGNTVRCTVTSEPIGYVSLHVGRGRAVMREFDGGKFEAYEDKMPFGSMQQSKSRYYGVTMHV